MELCVDYMGIIALNIFASSHNGRRRAHLVRRGTLIAWGGERLTPLAAGMDGFARHNGRHTRIVGAKTREGVSCFHTLLCFATALIVNASPLGMVSMLVVHYRHVTHSCVERASTCLASLNQHQRRCIFVADGLWAGHGPTQRNW